MYLMCIPDISSREYVNYSHYITENMKRSRLCSRRYSR